MQLQNIELSKLYEIARIEKKKSLPNSRGFVRYLLKGHKRF